MQNRSTGSVDLALCRFVLHLQIGRTSSEPTVTHVSDRISTLNHHMRAIVIERTSIHWTDRRCMDLQHSRSTSRTLWRAGSLTPETSALEVHVQYTKIQASRLATRSPAPRRPPSSHPRLSPMLQHFPPHLYRVSARCRDAGTSLHHHGDRTPRPWGPPSG